MEPLFFILGLAFFVMAVIFMFGPMHRLKEAQPEEYARITNSVFPSEAIWKLFLYLITNDYKKNIIDQNIASQFTVGKYLAVLPVLFIVVGIIYGSIT